MKILMTGLSGQLDHDAMRELAQCSEDSLGFYYNDSTGERQ